MDAYPTSRSRRQASYLAQLPDWQASGMYAGVGETEYTDVMLAGLDHA